MEFKMLEELENVEALSFWTVVGVIAGVIIGGAIAYAGYTAGVAAVTT